MKKYYKKEPIGKEYASGNYVQSITQRMLTSITCHECIIEKYSSLKERTYYTMTQEVADKERTLKLYKAKKYHSFQFHCELTNSMFGERSSSLLPENRMTFHIMYDMDKDRHIWSGNLLETNYGYSIEVSSEVVLHADNKYLHDDDKLVVQYRYRYYPYTRSPICHVGKATKSDEDALSNDFLSLYESGKFTDFFIQSSDGKHHRIHMCVCRARSVYLRNESLRELEGININTKSRFVEIVIRYMYGGKLPQLSVDDLLEVADVADALDVPTLRQSLTIALREKLNKDNAVKINEAAERCEMLQLVSYAKDFLPKEDKTEYRRRGRR